MTATLLQSATFIYLLLGAMFEQVSALNLFFAEDSTDNVPFNFSRSARQYLGLDHFEGTENRPSYPSLADTSLFATVFLIGVWALSKRVVKASEGLKPEPYKYSMMYASASFVCLSASFMGFFPGAIVAAQTGEWFSDAFARTNRPSVIEAVANLGFRWDAVLSMHIFSAFLWLVLAFGQIYSGLMGRFNERLLQWHRTAGTVAATVGVVALLLGLLLELLKPARVEGYVLVTVNVVTAVMVIVNIFVGIYYVRSSEKQVHNHKVAMAWACAWSADTGGVKLFSYFVRYLSSKSMYDPFVLTVSVVLWTSMMLAFLLSPASVDRNLRTTPQLCNIILLEIRLVCAAAAAVGLVFRTVLHAGAVVIVISSLLAGLNLAVITYHSRVMTQTESSPLVVGLGQSTYASIQKSSVA